MIQIGVQWYSIYQVSLRIFLNKHVSEQMFESKQTIRRTMALYQQTAWAFVRYTNKCSIAFCSTFRWFVALFIMSGQLVRNEQKETQPDFGAKMYPPFVPVAWTICRKKMKPNVETQAVFPQTSKKTLKRTEIIWATGDFCSFEGSGGIRWTMRFTITVGL